MAKCTQCKRLHTTEYRSCPRCLQRSRDWKAKNAAHNRLVNRKWKNVHWARRMVSHSRDGDILKNRLPVDLIDEKFLHEVREFQNNRCCSCTIDMQVYNRMLPDGLTVQRTNNTIGHSKANCRLSCRQCNSKRVETGCNKQYVRDTRARLYFERLVRGGYAILSKRAPKIINVA